MERVLATAVILAMVQRAQTQIFKTKDITFEECESGGCGATLYFYNSEKELIHYETGSVERIRIADKWGVRGAAYVRQVGTGCYKIYNRGGYTGENRELRDQTKVLDLIKDLSGWNLAIK